AAATPHARGLASYLVPDAAHLGRAGLCPRQGAHHRDGAALHRPVPGALPSRCGPLGPAGGARAGEPLARPVPHLAGEAAPASGAGELWRAVFGNATPVEIEIGPGRGDVLLAFAEARPDTNFFGIEHAAGLAASIAKRAAAAGLRNLRVVSGDARCILAELVPPGSVAAVHVYFPDPWPKTRHRHRRLSDRVDGAAGSARVLERGGAGHVASDLPALHGELCRRLAAAGLHEVDARPPVRPVSKFERKYATAGTWTATFEKRDVRL